MLRCLVVFISMWAFASGNPQTYQQYLAGIEQPTGAVAVTPSPNDYSALQSSVTNYLAANPDQQSDYMNPMDRRADEIQNPVRVPTNLPESGIVHGNSGHDSAQNILDKIMKLEKPTDSTGAPLDVSNLNNVINRVGRELQFLSEKSRECLYEKVRSLAQLKRMRDGLKHAYSDIYSLQYCLSLYQEQLREMQEYLKANRGRIVVVDNKQLGDMYSMVRKLQSAAEGMVTGMVNAEKAKT